MNTPNTEQSEALPAASIPPPLASEPNREPMNTPNTEQSEALPAASIPPPTTPEPNREPMSTPNAEQSEALPAVSIPPPSAPKPNTASYAPLSTKTSRRTALLMLASFGLGAGATYLLGDLGKQTVPETTSLAAAPAEAPTVSPTPIAQVNELASAIPVAYEVPAQFAQIGPQLLETGAIDYERFAAALQRSGQPLTASQIAILKDGSYESIVFDRANSYFLLNFFWALGLVNMNSILLEGPMTKRADGNIGGFASTGGWSAGTKPATELYSSREITELSAQQQGRLETVASAAYRPCCNNSTLFPDCNHGMAMLGLLEVVAATDAGLDDLYAVAKHANSFWYPQQATELALFFRHNQDQSFEEIDARVAVGSDVFSQSGFQRVHQWLANNGSLQQAPSGGSGCSL